MASNRLPALLGLFCLASISSVADSLITKPYLQLGDNRNGSPKQGLQLLWHSRDVETSWTLEFRPAGAAKWRRAPKATFKRIRIPGIPAHRVYQAPIAGLPAGATFEYRLGAAGESPFTATAKMLPAPGSPLRISVFGDCAADTAGQRAIAFQVAQQKPDMVHVTGDIVYSRGRITEYRTRFFPIYNAETPSDKEGAPLLRSVLLTAAPGNHDIQSADLDQNNDGLAYFYYWTQPLNGPVGPGNSYANPMKGASDLTTAFLSAAGAQFPRMSTFSFDYGDSHWLVLDSHGYVDWRDPALREWVRADLKAAQKARWRFASFHHPGFNSSKAHFADQQMRFAADLFEEGKVDVVFSGHVHNYQRSYPLTFRVDDPGQEKKVARAVGGSWTLDKSYDGANRTKPNGVIYVVTGAGGANLYNPEQQNDPKSWQEFTTRFTADRHSFTLLDLDANKGLFRQIDADGNEIDRFVIEK